MRILNKIQLLFAHIYWVTLLLVFVAIPTNAEMCLHEDGEIVEQHLVKETQELNRNCLNKDIKEITAAKEVVKIYWKISNKERYHYFSESYRTMLKRIYKIESAEDYSEHFPTNERTWQKQIYQKCLMGANFIQIIVLSAWFDEGYDGVMTFIFDMVKENNSWKIANIKF